ncbi:Mob1/phocein [Lepidopterella palustris CBS 459.81]|uniref:Mob1/phocein n=1 Tax=Lepidopterella palustris CBS 459.81 TaxID=1314670 RepID=A0A8E2E8I1_9PEZI|nr:Mob1/phocein [Lepidopterella palustris CBS 459.81]
MMAAVSPSSSPRLPSPPPIAEDQIGPKSPLAASDEQANLFGNFDHGAERRIRPGTKAADMAEGPPLVDLAEIDSAFQLTEHLKALHNFLTHPLGSTNSIPVDRPIALRLAQPPDGVDKSLWLYELCRFLVQKANAIIIALFSDNPPCSSSTCPEMRASEWQYLCAVHDPPKSCCAIDYCCHTLDWAANTLTSPKHFPSRLALGTEANPAHQQVRQLTNIFRRVYRIFAHAWFQHREMFWKVETRTGLYVFFKTVCDVYTLIPEDNFTIPSDAEGIETTPVVAQSPPVILQKGDLVPDEDDGDVEGAGATTAPGNTTKRHRHTPSVGASCVTTVVEENEEEEEQQPQHEQQTEQQQEHQQEYQSESQPEEVPKLESEPIPSISTIEKPREEAEQPFPSQADEVPQTTIETSEDAAPHEIEIQTNPAAVEEEPQTAIIEEEAKNSNISEEEPDLQSPPENVSEDPPAEAADPPTEKENEKEKAKEDEEKSSSGADHDVAERATAATAGVDEGEDAGAETETQTQEEPAAEKVEKADADDDPMPEPVTEPDTTS